MKFLPRTALLLLTAALPATAATYIGPAAGDWNTGANWDTGVVPSTSTGTSATISSGAVVDYPGTALGDFTVNNGAVVLVSGGSTLKTDETNWSQVNNGSLILTNGTFQRTAAGNLVGSQVAGIDGAPTSSVITATNSSIDLFPTGAANLILGYTNFTNSTLNLVNSTVTVGGEVWLGSNTANDTNQTATLNLNNSSISTNGAVGLWVWDYAAAGNNLHINFSGPAGSFINATNSIGVRRGDGTAANNAATWESLWDLGILTAEGRSGLTGDAFTSWFTTTGTNIRDTPTAVPYRLTYIPEPSSALLLLALASGSLTHRRRRTPAS